MQFNKDFMKLHKFQDGLKQDLNGWYAQHKIDGVFAALDLSSGDLYSRTGKLLYVQAESALSRTIQKLTSHAYANELTGLLIAEVICSGYSLEQLSGLLNPLRVQAWEDYVCNSEWRVHLHDWVQLTEDKDIRDYATRYTELCTHFGAVTEGAPLIASTVLKDNAHAEAVFQDYIGRGGEGIVVKNPDGTYQMGKRSNQQLKMVREHTEDVRIISAGYGKGKRSKQLARFECQSLDNPEIRFWADLGAGYDDAFRDDLTAAYEAVPESVVGTVWVVKGLQRSSTGKAVRLPKLQYRRFDKD